MAWWASDIIQHFDKQCNMGACRRLRSSATLPIRLVYNLTTMEIARTVLHLCSAAQLGVLTRIYIGKLFGAACHPGAGASHWVPCVTSPGLTRYGGALFIDLPANVVGSFVMGLLSTGDLLASIFQSTFAKGRALALLSESSSLQAHDPLHIGLRTGFCGSLTTFASWILQMTKMLVGGAPSSIGTEWVASLWGIYLGTAASLTALLLGEHVALKLCMLQHEQERKDAVVPTTSSTTVMLDINGSSMVPASPSQFTDGSNSTMAHESVQLHQQTTTATSVQHAEQSAQPTSAMPNISKVPGNMPHHRRVNNYTPACWLADLCAVVVLSALTTVSLTNILNGKSTEAWLAVLMGPAGCLLRWQLVKLNNLSSWFPWGTWAANITACTVDAIMALLLVRMTAWTEAHSKILLGITAGFGGSLSTDSTFVSELQRLHLRYPNNTWVYIYYFATMATAVVVGLAIYGTAVWTL